jgi:hypothetical protein
MEKNEEEKKIKPKKRVLTAEGWKRKQIKSSKKEAKPAASSKSEAA